MRSCSHGEQFSNEHVWPSRAADVPRSASIKTETPVFGRRRPCQAHASRRKRWITSSTILVSKSWTPCTRKHPFAHVAFGSSEKLQSWKTAFPDPSTSPARFARSLFISLPQFAAPVDTEDSWITPFSRVARGAQTHEPLAPFHGLSPIIDHQVPSSDF